MKFMKLNLKNEKGAVSLYVLLAMLLITITLVSLYVSLTNKHLTQLDIAEQIKATYEKDINNVDNVYINLVSVE